MILLRNGKFGCDKCYETFEDKIDSILKNIHGANNHVGRNIKQIENKENIDNKIGETKVNKNTEDVNEKTNNINEKEIKINKRIEELKLRLKQEIKEERYEDAAKTRDEIKKLEE